MVKIIVLFFFFNQFHVDIEKTAEKFVSKGGRALEFRTNMNEISSDVTLGPINR